MPTSEYVNFAEKSPVNNTILYPLVDVTFIRILLFHVQSSSMLVFQNKMKHGFLNETTKLNHASHPDLYTFRIDPAEKHTTWGILYSLLKHWRETSAAKSNK